MSGDSNQGNNQSKANPPDETFLSRWSRRKVEGAAVPEAATPSASVAGAAEANISVDQPASLKVPGTPRQEPMSPASPADKPELPSIESLTPEADFSPFMAKDVEPSLRNQAMKKLFADPHYGFDNMDKLDIYIDDYSKPDPIPIEMLKMMYQSKSLGLFDDDKDEAGEVADYSSGSPVNAAAVPACPVAQETSAPGLQGGTVSDGGVPPASAPQASSSASEDSANNHKKIAVITRADNAASNGTLSTDKPQSQ